MDKRSLLLGFCTLIGLGIGIWQRQILLYVALGLALGTIFWIFIFKDRKHQ